MYKKYQKHTMIHRNRFTETILVAQAVLAKFGNEDLIGAECGTWRGGMSFGLLDALPNLKSYHFFDSYEGLPDPTGLDSKPKEGTGLSHELWHDNNTATFEDVAASVEKFNFKDRVHMHKGWFNETLPKAEFPQQLSMLRMDGDWFESTLDILNNLYHQVRPGGLILIDDYYDWVGCSRAIHKFLADNDAPEQLHEIQRGQVAYIIKD